MGVDLQDMAWDRANNRMLAVSGQTNPGLYSVDLSTGAASFLGAVTGTGGGISVSLAISPAGDVFLHSLVSDRWFSVDMSTFAASSVAILPFNSNFQQGATFADGAIYHAATNQLSGGGALNRLLRVDPLTGLVTDLGLIGTNFSASGLELGDIAVAIAVPAPLASLMSLAGLAGLAGYRRRWHAI